MARIRRGPRQPDEPPTDHSQFGVWESRIRLWISVGGHNALGPGKVRLLEAIDSTHSLAAAARKLGMSYRLAWKHLRLIEEWTHTAVVQPQRGGTSGGGTSLTVEGKALLKAYRAFRGEVEEQMAGAFDRYFANWAIKPPAEDDAPHALLSAAPGIHAESL